MIDFICVQDFTNVSGVNANSKFRARALRMKVGGVQPDGTIARESLVADFEDVYLNIQDTEEATREGIITYLLSDGKYVGQAITRVDINKCINEIARETRRGGGNHLIYHEDDQAKIDAIYPAKYRTPVSLHPEKAPALKGYIIILYKGDKLQSPIDGCPILVKFQDNYACTEVGGDTKHYVKIMTL